MFQEKIIHLFEKEMTFFMSLKHILISFLTKQCIIKWRPGISQIRQKIGEVISFCLCTETKESEI